MRKTRILYPIIALFVIVLVIVLIARISAWRARVEYDRVVQEVAQWGLPTTLEELAEYHTLPEDAVNGRELVLAAYDQIDWPSVDFNYLPIAGDNEIDPTPNEPYPTLAMEEMRWFLESNADAIDEIRSAIHEPDYVIEIPVGAIWDWYYGEALDGNNAKFRMAARTLAIAAAYAVEEDRTLDAFALLEDVRILGLKEMQQPTTSAWINGYSLRNIALSQAKNILERAPLNPEQADACDGFIERFRETPDRGYSNWCDFLITSASLNSFEDQVRRQYSDVGNGAAIPPSAYLEILSFGAYTVLGRGDSDRLTVAKAMIADLRLHYGEENAEVLADRNDRRFTPFGLGEMYEHGVLYISDAGRKLANLNSIRVDGYRTLLAARRYANEHGMFPESLDGLIPEFMDEIPVDPYGGEALRYEIENGVVSVYSVGENGLDDGGYDPEEPHGVEDDWCVWIRIPAASATTDPE